MTKLCISIECAQSDTVSPERVRYFPGQLLTAVDMLAEQTYFRHWLHRHNRLLHGWGIVCGARVRLEGDCKLIVEPGYILGPYGGEVVIDHEVPLDLCHEDSECREVSDPWCIPVSVEPQARSFT